MAWTLNNLAALYRQNQQLTEAETIYRQFKDKLKEGFLDDFKRWAEVGVIPKEYEADVEKIKKMLNEK